MSRKDISGSRLSEMCSELVHITSGLSEITDEQAWEQFKNSFRATHEATLKEVFNLWIRGLGRKSIWDKLPSEMKNNIS